LSEKIESPTKDGAQKNLHYIQLGMAQELQALVQEKQKIDMEELDNIITVVNLAYRRAEYRSTSERVMI
jgi:hypothetical protein